MSESAKSQREFNFGFSAVINLRFLFEIIRFNIILQQAEGGAVAAGPSLKKV